MPGGGRLRTQKHTGSHNGPPTAAPSSRANPYLHTLLLRHNCLHLSHSPPPPMPLNTPTTDGFAITHANAHMGTAHRSACTRLRPLTHLCRVPTAQSALYSPPRHTPHPPLGEGSGCRDSRGEGSGQEGLPILCSPGTSCVGLCLRPRRGTSTQAGSWAPHLLFPPQGPLNPPTASTASYPHGSHGAE